MSSDTLPSLAAASHAAGPVPASAKIILALLGRLRHGALRLALPDGAVMHFGDGGAPVSLELKNWDLFGAAMRASCTSAATDGSRRRSTSCRGRPCSRRSWTASRDP